MIYLFTILIIFLDQISKKLAVKYLLGNEPIQIIGDFLQLNYVKNYGAGFGIFQNKQIFLIITTSIVMVAIIIFLIKINTSNIMKFSLMMIIGGALGNLIDRIRLGYVIDFIDVKFGSFYDYPVFNIADSFIVVGTIIIVYLILTDKYIKQDV